MSNPFDRIGTEHCKKCGYWNGALPHDCGATLGSLSNLDMNCPDSTKYVRADQVKALVEAVDDAGFSEFQIGSGKWSRVIPQDQWDAINEALAPFIDNKGSGDEHS